MVIMDRAPGGRTRAAGVRADVARAVVEDQTHQHVKAEHKAADHDNDVELRVHRRVLGVVADAARHALVFFVFKIISICTYFRGGLCAFLIQANIIFFI